MLLSGVWHGPLKLFQAGYCSAGSLFVSLGAGVVHCELHTGGNTDIHHAVVLAGAGHIDDLDGNDHAVERGGGMIYNPGSEVLIETYFISLVSILSLYISLLYLSFITLYISLLSNNNL